MSSTPPAAASTLQSRLEACLKDAASIYSDTIQKGLYGLASISAESGTQVVMCNTKGVVEAMLKASTQGTTTEIRKQGLLGLANIATASENRQRLCETKGVTEAMVQAARFGATTDIKLQGLTGLANLTVSPENMPRLYETDGVLQAMLRAAQSGETVEMRQQGLLGMVNLATHSALKVAIHGYPGVVDVMQRAGWDGETMRIKELGLMGLVNIAVSDETKVPLCDRADVVEAFVKAAQHWQAAEIKIQGLMGISSLAVIPENKLRLYEVPGVVEALRKAAQAGETRDIMLEGFRGIWSLSSVIAVAESLVQDHDILSLLTQTSFDDDSILSVIYLSLAVAPFARTVLKEDKAAIRRLEILGRSVRDTRTPVASRLALAILRGSDADSELLRTDKSTFNSILEILQGAISGKAVLNYRWPLNQPLLALRYLTTIESNREALGTDWLVLLPEAIGRGLTRKDATIVECAIRCLSQYALEASTLPVLKAKSDLYVSVANHVVGDGPDSETWIGAKKSAKNLIFALTGQGEREEKKDLPIIARQVMISYAWGPPPYRNQQVASQVEAFLRDCGFSVWRDEAKMKQDIMAAMAEAVLTSSAIIVLVTKSYMESDNCKCELQLARRSKKMIVPLLVEPHYNHTIDGWLGAAIGSLLYYDISSLAKREESLKQMVQKEFPAETASVPLPALTRRPSVRAKRVLNGEETIRSWAKEVKLPEEVENALVSGGFLENDLLEGLVEEPPSELVKLLGLSLPAHGLRLRLELKKLFATT